MQSPAAATRGSGQATVATGKAVIGPCTLAVAAMRDWSQRNVSTVFLIACISTALVWTCSLAIAMLNLAALAARP